MTQDNSPRLGGSGVTGREPELSGARRVRINVMVGDLAGLAEIVRVRLREGVQATIDAAAQELVERARRGNRSDE